MQNIKTFLKKAHYALVLYFREFYNNFFQNKIFWQWWALRYNRKFSVHLATLAANSQDWATNVMSSRPHLLHLTHMLLSYGYVSLLYGKDEHCSFSSNISGQHKKFLIACILLGKDKFKIWHQVQNQTPPLKQWHQKKTNLHTQEACIWKESNNLLQ